MNRKILWLVLIALILLLYLIFPLKANKEVLKIGRDPQEFGVDLFGREAAVLALTDQVIEATPSRLQPVRASREFFRGALDRGEIAGFIYFGEGEGSAFRDLIYSNTFFPLGPILVVRSDSPINYPQDLKGQSIALIKNSSIFLELDRLPPFKIQTVDTIWTLFDYALLRRVDGIILDTLPAYLYLQRIHKGALRFIPPPLTRAGLKLFALPTPAGHDLINQFNHDLATMMASGKLKEIYSLWDFSDYPLPPLELSPQ